MLRKGLHESAAPFLLRDDPLPDDADSWWTRLPLARGRPVFAYGLTIFLMLVAAATRYALLAIVPTGMPFTLFFPVIVACAILFGMGPGILAAVIGFVFAWYFFVPPVGFALGAGAPVALVLYSGVVTTSLFLIRVMQRANARALAAHHTSLTLAETRETLFRELQHRVGNNLQIVSSLLSLQKRKLTDPAAIAAISEAADRIKLIGQIQRELYSTDGVQLHMADFLERLVHEGLESAGRDDVTCQIAVPDTFRLAPDSAIPTALIVCEAVANALEHGLPDCAGTIVVEALQAGHEMEIAVIDNGRGLPPGFALEHSDSLGLKLAFALARQCGGRFDLASANGTTRAVLYLPLPG